MNRDQIIEALAVAKINSSVAKPEKATSDTDFVDVIFEMSLEVGRSKLVLDPGLADVTIYPDADKRQVVMHVKEDARTIERTYKVRALNAKKAREDFKKGSRFPLHLPGEQTTYEVVGAVKNVSPKDMPGIKGIRFEFEGTVKATVAASTMWFLVGYDEGNLFICRLPKSVKTVEAAHKSLRPKNVPEGSLRQGEWFFVPVTDDKLKDKLDKQINAFNESEQLGDSSRDSSHHALIGVTDGVWTDRKQYAIGLIVDEQENHKHLRLDGWHLAVHNLEVDPPAGVESNSWD